MVICFDACTVVEELVADNDPPYLQVGISDAAGRHYLLIHRTQPVGGGEDWGVYIEVDDQLLSGYDCVASCELTTAKLRLHMKSPLSKAKPVEVIEVRFADRCRPSPEMVARLREIFAGYEDCLRVSV